jgi:LysM repeat protein
MKSKEMKFDLLVKDRAGNGVDNLKYRIMVIVDKNRKIKRELVSSVTKNGKGKGETIIGLEELIFEVIGFPSAYSNWTEIGSFSYGKRMNKDEKRTITIIVPSIIINTKTFPKQEISGNYQRRLKTLKAPLDEKIYLYPSIVKHIVTQGENLESIARKHKTTVEEIKLRNKTKGDIIKIGDELIIKDKGDVNKELWTAQKAYKKHIKENFVISKDNSKVITTIEQESGGTQLMYVNVSGAIAALIGVGASIQL